MSALLHAAIESNEHENNNSQNNEEFSNNNSQHELKEESKNEEKEDEQNKNNSPVEWMKDEDSPNCTLCKKAFSLTFRRHHCRACGKIFCAKCSSLEALLPPQYHYQNGMERVCDECSYSQWPYHSEIANTEIGNIEYCKIGHGEKVILCIHGSYGDFSHGLALNYYFINDKEKLSEYTLISYSRPGYGRTKQDLSISTTSFESQAQIIFYLLKFLLISQQVHVIAYSTGGPIAIQFAGQFPSLVASITLISAITRKYWPGQAKGLSEDESPLKPLPSNTNNNNENHIDHYNDIMEDNDNIDNNNNNNNNENINKIKEKPSITTKISRSFQSIGLWFAKKLVSNYPTGTKVMLKNLISESSLFDDSSIDRHVERIIADPLLVWLFQAVCLSMQNSDGFSIDMTAARNIEEWDLEGIETPTLVIHGRNDGDVPITHAEEIVSKLPNAKLLSLDDTDHMVWLSSSRQAVEQYIVDFIHSPSSFIIFDHHEEDEGGLSIGRSTYSSESSNPVPVVEKEEKNDNTDQKFSLEEVDEKKVQHTNSLIGNKLVQKKIKKAAIEHQFLEEQMFDL